ncbi:MAG: hypothetical protein OXQ29_03750, partial [Rhodospirillaceae bacterium]|nr:hypothetical protein [Rhodospirillaceae bacterium]
MDKGDPATVTVAVDDGAAATRVRNTTTTAVLLKLRRPTPRTYRSAQCPKCEGQVLELEGELVGDAGVPVTLAQGETVIMSYRTADRTAKAGQDYVQTTGTLTFTSQELNPVITVATLEDELNETDEFFTVTLLPADLPDGSRTDRLDYTLTILDDDGLTATLSAERLILEEGEPATFTVELRGGTSTAPVEVKYRVAE